MYRPELMSKFSSDGEDSFVDFSQMSPPSRKKVRDEMHSDVMVNRRMDLGMEINPGRSFQPPTPVPTQLPKHPTFIRRLTTKLRIATPPSSPPPNALYFDHRSPPHPTTTPNVNSFASQELHACALWELFPQDRNMQEDAQDIHFHTDDTSDSDEEERWDTEAKRIMRRWEARDQGINTAAEKLTDPVPLKAKGPIYPDVLATPQFGRSKSTPDLTWLEPTRLQAMSRSKTSRSATSHSTSTTSTSGHSVLEGTQILNDQALYCMPPPPMVPNPPNWLQVPTQTMRSTPATPPFSSSISFVSASSRSFISSGGNSFAADDPLTPMSTRCLTPSPGHRLAFSGMAGVSLGADATRINAFSVTTRNLDVERTPVIVNKHVGDGETASSIMVHVEGDTDTAQLTFPRLKGSRTNDQEKGPSTLFGNNGLRNEDLSARHARDAHGFQGRTRRSKSFVEQSFQNLRKSITVTISRARPKLPAMIPSDSRSAHVKFPQLPPSPTFPVSSSARPGFSSSTRRDTVSGFQVSERTRLDLRRYTIEER